MHYVQKKKKLHMHYVHKKKLYIHVTFVVCNSYLFKSSTGTLHIKKKEKHKKIVTISSISTAQLQWAQLATEWYPQHDDLCWNEAVFSIFRDAWIIPFYSEDWETKKDTLQKNYTFFLL